MDPSRLKQRVFVVTAPSGTGKTTMTRSVVGQNPAVKITISHTTRQKRLGETNGDHYWFVNDDEFDHEIKLGHMLEWASVFENRYGTSRKEVERLIDQGAKAILEIDVQGWMQVKEKLPQATSIFIYPPSMKILWSRLTQRGSEDFHTCWKRFLAARSELNFFEFYSHFIINDHLDQAILSLESILNHNISHLSVDEGVLHGQKLRREFDESDWVQTLKAQFGV